MKTLIVKGTTIAFIITPAAIDCGFSLNILLGVKYSKVKISLYYYKTNLVLSQTNHNSKCTNGP